MMPPNFSHVFRARQMLDHWPLDPKKNYRARGYQPLQDGLTNIFDRFEDVDEPLQTTYEPKSAAKNRVKK